MRCRREGRYLVPTTCYLVTPTGELEGVSCAPWLGSLGDAGPGRGGEVSRTLDGGQWVHRPRDWPHWRVRGLVRVWCGCGVWVWKNR